MKVVVKSFLRYLIRRRSLSFLQLLGIACGVAAAVGMFFSSQTALSNFSNTVSFLNGNTTHTIQRPAGPLGEEILVDILGHPAVEAFSPVIDRRILLKTGDLIRIMGLDIFLDRGIRTEFGALSLFTEQSQDKTLSFLDSLPPSGTASMQRDIMEGRPSELEAQTEAVEWQWQPR